MKKNEQLIGEIMMDHLPKNILGALRVMASLTYPISDRRSFLAQLETLGKDPQKSPPSELVEALDLVRGALTADNFPILTPVSGLEKIFAHYSNPHRKLTGLKLNCGFMEDPRLHYREMFLGACADLAFEVYEDSLRRGIPCLDSNIRGVLAGRDCESHAGYITSAWDPYEIDYYGRWRRGIPEGEPGRFLFDL